MRARTVIVISSPEYFTALSRRLPKHGAKFALVTGYDRSAVYLANFESNFRPDCTGNE